MTIIIGTFALGANGAYYRHARYIWDLITEYKFSVNHTTADVLFVGDSALQFGVIPNLIQQLTGFSAFNLALAGTTIQFATPELLLDNYLSSNQPPRLIVLYVDARVQISEPTRTPEFWYEGAAALVRHGGIVRAFSYFVHDPKKIIQFPYLIWRQILYAEDFTGATWNAATHEMMSQRGYLSYEASKSVVGSLAPSKSLPADCRFHPRSVEPDRGYFQRFRERYAKSGIMVAIYLAPWPRCDRSYEDVARAYEPLIADGIVDNQIYILPPSDFAADDQIVHLLDAGAERNTVITAEFVRNLVGRAPSICHGQC